MPSLKNKSGSSPTTLMAGDSRTVGSSVPDSVRLALLCEEQWEKESWLWISASVSVSNLKQARSHLKVHLKLRTVLLASEFFMIMDNHYHQWGWIDLSPVFGWLGPDPVQSSYLDTFLLFECRLILKLELRLKKNVWRIYKVVIIDKI